MTAACPTTERVCMYSKKKRVPANDYIGPREGDDRSPQCLSTLRCAHSDMAGRRHGLT
jgi:hypothetical protein